MPWSFPFLKHLPGATKSWMDMQVVGENIVKQRVSAGSNNPDLFHYLVSLRDFESARDLTSVACRWTKRAKRL